MRAPGSRKARAAPLSAGLRPAHRYGHETCGKTRNGGVPTDAFLGSEPGGRPARWEYLGVYRTRPSKPN
jgi:hypothetical protein